LPFLFASKPEAIGAVLGIVHCLIAGWLADQAGVERARAQCGTVTLIQRFGSELNLNIHFHYALARRFVPEHRAVTAQAATSLRPRARFSEVDGTGWHDCASHLPAPDAPRLARRRRGIRVPVRQRG
jgi:hypothetical protein